MKMTRMHNPPHPGLTLRDDVLPALSLSVTQAAAQLGVSRVAFSRVINGRNAISPEMALRIEAWLGIERGGEDQLWLAQQSTYDVGRQPSDSKLSPCTLDLLQLCLNLLPRPNSMQKMRRLNNE